MAEKSISRVAAARQAKNLSQAALAQQTGLSRPAISAIETGRVTPAVTAALALARVLELPVEQLFGGSAAADREAADAGPRWAIEPPRRSDAKPVRYWEADINGRVWRYPTEPTLLGMLPHDGVVPTATRAGRATGARSRSRARGAQAHAPETLVIATCDPAVGILAAAIREQTAGRLRLLPLMRSSAAAVALLAAGKVHAAGVHMAAAGRPADNLAFARAQTGVAPLRGLHLADWQTGVVLRERGRFGSAAAVARARLNWVGREAGAGARRCLDELLGPRRRYVHLAPDHAAVATAVQCGWADAGVCPQLTAAESRLAFLPVHCEAYGLCLTADPAADWRLLALQNALRSADYRRRLGELPGCHSAHSGRSLG